MASDITTQKAAEARWLTAFGIPDRSLELWEAESTYTAAEPIPTAAVPSGDETLAVRVSGTPTGTTPLEVRTLRGGLPDQGAGFEWREEGGTWLQRADTTELSDAELLVTTGANVVSLASTTLLDGRAVLVRLEEDQSDFMYASVEQEDGSFVGAFVDFVPTSPSSRGPSVDIITRPDGSLDIFTWGSSTLHRYRSTDEGATWEEVSVAVDGVWSSLQQGSGTGRIIAVAEGDGRLLLMESSNGGQYASEDGGYTWELVQAHAEFVDEWLSALFVPGVGFLVSGDRKIYLFDNPFLPVYREVETGSTSDYRTSLAFIDGVYWAVEVAGSGTTDDKAAVSIRTSLNGLAWSDATTHSLTSEEYIDHVLVPSRGHARLVVAVGLEVWSHRLGGWSSLGQQPAAQSWRFSYAPEAAKLPSTVPDADAGNADGGGTVDATSSSTYATVSNGELVYSEPGSGDELAEWKYTSVSNGDQWTAEVEVEVTASDGDAGVELVADTTDWLARVRITDTGIDLRTAGASLATAAVTGRIVVRFQLEPAADNLSATARTWYRSAGSDVWTIGPSGAASATGAGVQDATWLRFTVPPGDDLQAKVWGWRVADVVEAHRPGVPQWSARPIYLADGLSVAATQGVTHPGDTWTVAPGAEYSPERLLPSHPSPRQGWRATVNGDATLVYRVPAGEQASAHVVLLEKARANAVTVSARIAGVWVSYGNVVLRKGFTSPTNIGDHHARPGSLGSTSDPLEYIAAGELVGCAYTTSAGVHEVLANTGGVLADSANQTAGEKLTLRLDSTPATGTSWLYLQRGAAILHHAVGVEVEAIRLEVVATDGIVPRLGNAVIAPVTWLPEGPDHTATTGLDLRGETVEESDGTEHVVRMMPDRRRLELNFARATPMYASAAGDFDFFRAGDDVEVAATAWTMPQVLMSIADRAGRYPVVYLPAVEIDLTKTGGDLQALTYSEARQVVHGRLAMASVRQEGILGQHGTADQLVRGSSWTITEVV